MKNMSIFEKLIGEIKIRFNFLNRRSSPSNKASLKSSAGNIVQQAGRDLNIGVGHSEDVSDLERKILQKLYREYKSTGRLLRWGVAEAYKELGIAEGSYVGVLNDSRYVRLDGSDLVLTNDGIRYMDSRFSQNRPKIDLARSFSVSGGSGGNEITFQIKNGGGNPAVDVKFRLSSDETETPPVDIDHNISPGGTSREIHYRYTDTEFFREKLSSPRILFFYKDPEGNEFTSGRFIFQTPRGDGNFNIHSRPGDYFDN